MSRLRDLRVSVGRSIRVSLADGTPGGLLTAEIMNWTGHIVAAPRSDLAVLLRRSESSWARGQVASLRSENLWPFGHTERRLGDQGVPGQAGTRPQGCRGRVRCHSLTICQNPPLSQLRSSLSSAVCLANRVGWAR